MERTLTYLPDAELEVMRTLWQGGPCPVHTVFRMDRLKRILKGGGT